MIYSHLYWLSISDISIDLAHVYEHVIIDGFYDFLVKHSADSTMNMWIEGKTFEDVLFISGLFYDKNLSHLFNDYRSDLPEVSPELIEKSIATISAEEKVNLRVDIQELLSSYDILRKRKWNYETIDMPIVGPRLEIVDNSQNYRDIVLKVTASSLDTDEQKVFLRLKLLFIDTIIGSLRTLEGVHYGGQTQMFKNDDSLGFMTKLTIASSIDSAQIENSILKAYRSIDVESLKNNFALHFSSFSREPMFQSLPIDYYYETGIVTTTQEIANLATTSRIESIINKVSISVDQMDDQHADLF